MHIRPFRSGDEADQMAIYNAAASSLPNFKPATLGEIQRRTRARDFDPASRLIAEVEGQPVGYANFSPNGRVSFPWCLSGQEHVRQPLFQALLQTMRERGLKLASAAYRENWPAVHDFLIRQGFRRVRDMVNFYAELGDLPTSPNRSQNISPLEPADIPIIYGWAPQILRVENAEQLAKELLKNPYYGPEATFVLRSRVNNEPLGLGVFITNPPYADPRVLDSDMPCFRLGAIGTEGMQTKRVRGLFSFLARPDRSLQSIGLDLLGHAQLQLEDTDDIHGMASQAASDASPLHDFYKRHFRRQGSFPVFELDLTVLK